MDVGEIVGGKGARLSTWTTEANEGLRFWLTVRGDVDIEVVLIKIKSMV